MRNIHPRLLLASALAASVLCASVPVHAQDDVRTLKDKIQSRDEVIASLQKQVMDLKRQLAEKDAPTARPEPTKPEARSGEKTGEVAKKTTERSEADEVFSTAAKDYAKAYANSKKSMLAAMQNNLRGTVVFGKPTPKFRAVLNDLTAQISGDHFYVGKSAGAPAAWIAAIPNIVADNGGVEHPGPFDVGFHGMRCEQVIDDHTVLASQWAIANGAVRNIDDRETVAIVGLESTNGLVDKAPWASPHIALVQSGSFSYIGASGAKRTVKKLWAFRPEKLHEAGMEILHPELKKAREAKEKNEAANEAAFVGKEMKATQADIQSGKLAARNDIEKKILGTTWNWWEAQTIIFLADGRVVFPQHRKTGTWKTADVKNRVINGTMPWGSGVFTYKFNSDFTEAQRAEGKKENEFPNKVRLILSPDRAKVD